MPLPPPGRSSSVSTGQLSQVGERGRPDGVTETVNALAILLVTFGALAGERSGAVTTAHGPSLSAPTRFEYPEGLALDRAGNLLIVASRQHQVFRMIKGGEIQLVVGSGR